MENSFIKTIVKLEGSEKSSLFDRNVIAAIKVANFDEPSYSFGQALEPSMLTEAAIFSGIPYDNLQNLDHEGSLEFDKLRWLVQNERYLHNWNRITVSAALASICRYEAAERIISKVDETKLNPVWKALYLSYRFLLANRLGRNYEEIIKNMASIAGEEGLSDPKRLEIIAQIIVWNEKEGQKFANELSNLRYLEQSLEKSLNSSMEFSAQAALSSYYRAKAMEPKGPGSREFVQKLMDRCIDSASRLSTNSEIGSLIREQLIKTYHESSIKEGIYVRRDLAYAQRMANALVELDPMWSISWQQKAEVEFLRKDYETALQSIGTAVHLGAPRVPQHLYYQFQIAKMTGDIDLAHQSLSRLAELDPENSDVTEELMILERELTHV